MKKTCAWVALIAPLACHADGSLPGPTGLLTVPTAEVLPTGSIRAGVNSHDSTPAEDGTVNYLFGIGFAPGLELGGRVAQTRGFNENLSDLSFNAKLQVLRLEGGAALALGATDIGGEKQHFRSRYAVVTIPWQTLRFTAGHGWGQDIHEGTLAGLEWRPWTAFGLYAEYDTEATNGGMRLQSPDVWAGLRLGANAGYRGEEKAWEGGIEFSLPLGRRPRASPPTVTPAANPRGNPATRSALEDLGFESVRTGTRPDGTLVVSLENRRYNHSSADGIGLALGAIATRAAPEVPRIELNVSAYGVPQVAATTSPEGWREFLGSGVASPGLLDVRYINGAQGVAWDNAPAGLHALELYLEPALRTFVATDYGVLDAGVGARARLVVPLAAGVIAQAGAQVPLYRSDDFQDGGNYEEFGPEAGLDLLVGQYAHKPAPWWTSVWSAGLMQVIQTDLSVFGTEQAWTSPQGSHRFNAKLMSLSSGAVRHTVALGGYTWHDAARRYSAGITAGRFYFDDRGVRLDLNRTFDDTIAGLFLKVEGRENMAAGFQMSIPLTPRRDAAPHGLQVKGPRRWSHSLQSTLNLADGTNTLKPLLLHEPVLDLDLRRDFLDSGRLGPDYLLNELPRMREAWELWGD